MERVKPTTAQLVAVADLLGRAGREIESTVRGDSMGRTLPAGSRIRISRGTPDDVALGSVVAVAAGDMIFAHRVVGRRGTWLLTRGDGVLLCDEPVALDRVVGVVTHCNDGSGWRPVAQPAVERRSAALYRRVLLAMMALSVALAGRVARLVMRASRARLS